MASDCWRTCEPRRRREQLSVTSCCAPPKLGTSLDSQGNVDLNLPHSLCVRGSFEPFFWCWIKCIPSASLQFGCFSFVLLFIAACWMPGRSNRVAPIRAVTVQAEPVKDLLPLLPLNSLQVFSISPDICLLFPPLSFSDGTPLLSLLC